MTVLLIIEDTVNRALIHQHNLNSSFLFFLATTPQHMNYLDISFLADFAQKCRFVTNLFLRFLVSSFFCFVSLLYFVIVFMCDCVRVYEHALLISLPVSEKTALVENKNYIVKKEIYSDL